MLKIKYPKQSRYDELFPTAVKTLYKSSHITTTTKIIKTSELQTARNTFARRPLDQYHVIQIVEALQEQKVSAI